MPASRLPYDRPRLLRDDRAVSEIVGQILMFGILSMVLIMTLFSFNVAKEAAEDRVLDTTAASVAQRVASLVVDTALFAENFEEDQVDIQSRLELPAMLESRQYEIDLDASHVRVTSGDTTQRAPLFSAGSPTIVHVCDQDPIEGGAVRVYAVADFDYDPDDPPASDGIVNVDDGSGNPVELTVCAGAPESSIYIYLEAAP